MLPADLWRGPIIFQKHPVPFRVIAGLLGAASMVFIGLAVREAGGELIRRANILAERWNG